MDIFNRPPSISEDTLHYTLYPPPQTSDKSSVTSLAACIREYVDGLLPNFIWHRDAFELKAAEDCDAKKWYLEGRMRVGDCVDDEWCTVWLLREISSKWDLVISVWDTDGEFLLIEAADALPPWVKPSNAENRVWIYNSRLHLIPLSHISPFSRKRHQRKHSKNVDNGGEDNLNEDDEFIAPEDAVNLIRDDSISTLSPAEVEAAVWCRISAYPRSLYDHLHTARANIPTDVAKALLANPSLVQKAVETFYTRDAIQLRAAHRMLRFPPSTNILRSVRMTRTAYAQLAGQKFFPPKIFGQWTESEGNKEYKWRDIGMKIAVGFEMLYQESKCRSPASEAAAEKSKSEANKDALRRNTEYIQYIHNLKSRGFFKGEKEGSQLWNNLETKAVNAFIDVRSSSRRTSFAEQVELAILEARSIGDPGLQGEDDESWLTIDAQDFEAKLEKTLGQTSSSSQVEPMDVDTPEMSGEDRVASEQASRLRDLATKVERFVEGEGDTEGARFEDEEFSDEPFSDGDVDEDSDEESARNHPINYNTRNSATKEAMDKLVPGLDPSDYGRMPASYYRNSQRVAPTTVATDVVDNIGSDGPSPRRSTSSGTTGSKPIRAPILPRDKFDGVDSDDESDEEEEELGDGIHSEEDEEDMPQVVGDVDIDMGEEEEEFLEFARQALGISDEQWNEIVQDRKGRGAFVPRSAKKAATSAAPKAQPIPPTEAETRVKREPRAPQPGPRPNVNPQLDSFEAVMNAMDAELSRLRTGKVPQPAQQQPAPAVRAKDEKGKGKEKVEVVSEDEDSDIDIEGAMEAELKATLEKVGDDDDGFGEQDGSIDYNMIKNFLESFKGQAGLAGPVSNLAGRLEPGFQFPRDGF